MEQPRFKLEVLSEVLRQLGCSGGRHGAGWRWVNPSGKRPGHLSAFSYVPDRGRPWILWDEIVTGTLRLEKDPDDVVARVKKAGGEILEP